MKAKNAKHFMITVLKKLAFSIDSNMLPVKYALRLKLVCVHLQ